MARRTVDQLLAQARQRIAPRRKPHEALDAARNGALLVDLRSSDERRREGVIPGSLHIPRSVLEWRADPDTGWTNPHLGDLNRELILVCAEGCSSSLAAATLRELGYSRATDLVGGFAAWKASGQPTRPAPMSQPERLGMGNPEPAETANSPSTRRRRSCQDDIVLIADERKEHNQPK
jgi:rhodanese-related sulfurtransferase